MEELAKRFAEAKAKYQTLKQKVESEVVRWEWATGPFYEFLPFAHLRTRFKGKILKTEPASKDGCWQYGFNVKNKIVLIRQFTEFENTFYEEFFFHTSEFIEGWLFHYSDEKDPVNVTTYEYQANRLIHFRRFAQMGSTKENYEYKSDQLVGAQVIQQEHGQAETTFEIQFKYDDFGVITTIEYIYPNGYRNKVYQAKPKNLTLQSLLQIVEEKLLTLIPEVIKNAKISEDVYCLILAYDDQAMFPPLLGIGLESERHNWLTIHAENAKDYLWNPAEFKWFETENLWLTDESLNKVCDLVNQEIELKGNTSVGIRTLNLVAKALALKHWSNVLNTTKDFVVFAVDLHQSDLAKNIKVSVQKEHIDAFKQKGWL